MDPVPTVRLFMFLFHAKFDVFLDDFQVIPLSDPLGPAVMLLLLDECPLPTKESVAEFLAHWPLTKQSSQSGEAWSHSTRHLENWTKNFLMSQSHELKRIYERAQWSARAKRTVWSE